MWVIPFWFKNRLPYVLCLLTSLRKFLSLIVCGCMILLVVWLHLLSSCSLHHFPVLYGRVTEMVDPGKWPKPGDPTCVYVEFYMTCTLKCWQEFYFPLSSVASWNLTVWQWAPLVIGKWTRLLRRKITFYFPLLWLMVLCIFWGL